MNPSITADMVLIPRSGADVSCHWCQKIVKVCDGRLTLAQVAERLHLPVQVCLKLANRAHHQGWVDVNGPAPVAVKAAPATNLWPQLLAELGTDSAAIMSRAARMSRCAEGEIPPEQLGNFLLAVELLLPEKQRATLIPRLDYLRHQYGF